MILDGTLFLLLFLVLVILSLTVWMIFSSQLSQSSQLFQSSQVRTLNEWSHDVIIVANHYNEDLKWLEPFVQNKSAIVCSKKYYSSMCDVPINKGREASGYLKFIIDNFHNLPKNMAFLHGHEKAYHQKYNILKLIKCAKINQYGYFGLNHCYFDDRKIATNKIMKEMQKIWYGHFKPFLKRECPIYLLHDCCAQFIVSRERVLRNSRGAYQHWYQLLMKTKNDYHLGLVFEYIWHIIFGEPDVVSHEDNASRFVLSLLNNK